MYAELPEPVEGSARRSYRTYHRAANHPSLRVKKVDEEENLYSARIGNGYRAVGKLDGDEIVWFWIGTHAEYDKLL